MVQHTILVWPGGRRSNRGMHLVRFGRQGETDIIERQRGGWRLFKTIDAAVQTARNIGFRRVEIDVSGMRD